MNKVIRIAVGVMLIAFGQAFAMAVPASEDVPTQTVKVTIEGMIEVLTERRGELEASPGKLYTMVQEQVVPRFDFSRISRYTLGKYWRRASAEQKDDFTNEFKKLLIRTYAKAISNYSGQKIAYLPSRAGKKESEAMVMTMVSEEGGPKIPVNYRMHQSDDAWLVYDIIIDGVSLVSNYRTSFASKIRRAKLDGLIAQLRQRNDEASL